MANNYRDGAWWAGHGAEIIGAVAGFVVGFVIMVAVAKLAPAAEVGWIPLVTLVAGALGLRAVTVRQLRRR